MDPFNGAFEFNWREDFNPSRVAKFAIRFGMFYGILGFVIVFSPVISIDLTFFCRGLLTIVGLSTLLIAFAMMTDGRGVLPFGFSVLTGIFERLPFPIRTPPLLSGLILLLVGVSLIVAGVIIRVRMRNREARSDSQAS